MFSGLATKIALKKAGLPSDSLNFNWGGGGGQDEPKKLTKSNTARGQDFDNDGGDNAWPAWISKPTMPMAVAAWLSPPPPPVPVAKDCPNIGEMAPLDRDRKLRMGGGQPTLLVFLRCVGCAFAQKTFLALRAISVKYPIRCVAVSHSSATATRKWLDMLGGEWSIEVVIDEDRAIYAAWGLGLCSVWHVFNPSSQAQAWKETGWLGDKVATAVNKEEERAATMAARRPPPARAPSVGKEAEKGGRWKLGRAKTGGSDTLTRAPTAGSTASGQSMGAGSGHGPEEDGPGAAGLGNKWQTAGAFAVDGRGTVIWGGKAAKVDDVLDLDAGVRILRA
ncbi:hypothetical protein F5X68DRAFT_263057 [Plectosphaerella plurivora]|uniref:Alkyl hydroperoxide reductase subunit C/ Thiol specific antioxidant domain-containing protein n=1 Tax=Plectosphaerella plurivora TaxID=936078 RepID=A0A9P8V8H2_9PEZI|nr:hypothetical protein F5X68DRAFT_263057 [Plectosphaerella plurivora]